MEDDIDLLHWEDFEPGQTCELGSHEFTLDEMLEFAERYDPQVFHVDEEGARGHPFGGIIASGCLTFAVGQRLLVDGLLGRAASQGSPGIDEMRFLAPVRPRDVLRGRLEVSETRESSRRPARGTITIVYTLINQREETVLSMRARVMLKRREPASRPVDTDV
ncbi:MAG: MaoC family dehydratase [Gaiella sp.]|nr:MaoC family dehydratase [Gaiella sp.]